MGNAADGQEGAQFREALHAPVKELAAAFDFATGRLILRGNASHRVRDHTFD